MPNMSYCRFENTSNDIQDCIDALEEENWDFEQMIVDASDTEAEGMRDFVRLCREVTEAFADEEI